MTKMLYMRSIILVHILYWYIFVMETKADPEVCIEATYTLLIHYWQMKPERWFWFVCKYWPEIFIPFSWIVSPFKTNGSAAMDGRTYSELNIRAFVHLNFIQYIYLEYKICARSTESFIFLVDDRAQNLYYRKVWYWKFRFPIFMSTLRYYKCAHVL